MDTCVEVTDKITVISGDNAINRQNNPGYFLMKSGSVYHYKEIEESMGLAVIHSYGYKLEYNFYHPTTATYARVPSVAIGWSAKKWGDG